MINGTWSHKNKMSEFCVDSGVLIRIETKSTEGEEPVYTVYIIPNNTELCMQMTEKFTDFDRAALCAMQALALIYLTIKL